MQRISVLFPEPDGPHKTIFSPPRTDRLTSVRALKSPYHFSTCSIRIIGVARSVARGAFMVLSLTRAPPLFRDEGHAFDAVRERHHGRAHPFLLNLGELPIGFDLVDERV